MIKKLEASSRPNKPDNHIIGTLRKELNSIFDWLTPEHGAPILATHFGVTEPSKVEATGLIEAIDKLHNRADVLMGEQEDAERAEAEAADKTKRDAEANDKIAGNGAGGEAATTEGPGAEAGEGGKPPKPLDDKSNDASKQ